MKKTAVVTIASENYFAQVQTLLDSLLKTNPKWDRYFAVVDEPDLDLIEALKKTNTKLIKMDEIGIPDINDMKFRYDIMELNTAIKPFVLLKLMEEYECVVYLDPDICVYDEMREVNDAFEKGYEFVVTPHFSDYFSEDGKHPDEPDIMRAGVYNFGFFAVSSSKNGVKAVKWWANKLETLCINKQQEGIFVDQKWMDLLPGRHKKVYILRNNGYNTAYWNLSHRVATYKNGQFYFNNDKLVFFHFSGYNAKTPDIVSKHQNRHSMDDLGVAKKLFYNYSKEVLNNDFDKWRKKKYSYNNFSDGREIKNIFRYLYREEKEVYNRIANRNPIECSDIFYDNKEWLSPMLINYAISTHSNVGVYFINSSRNDWIEWFGQVCNNEYGLDQQWVDFAVSFFSNVLAGFSGESVDAIKYFKEDRELLDGVNLVGYIKSEHGVGEACRLTAQALATTTIDWNAYDWEINNPSRQSDNSWNEKIEQNINYDISIFNINADQLFVAKDKLPKDAWKGYKIGIWYWELTEFPNEWCQAFDLVDEIWAPTKFIQECLLKKATVPVIYMPPGIKRDDPDAKYTREYFNLPDAPFMFLNFFDAFSYTSRKNPFAAIKAFQMAFNPDDMSVGLVLKVNNVLKDDENVKKLEKAIAGYKNIYIIAKTMSRGEVNGLINVCDASVSLHRSEGLGLLCEESMYYGKPVIATNWSGNTDFMTSDTSCLVDYEMIPVEEYYCTNDSSLEWADPDIRQASEFMIKLFEDKEYYDLIAQNAKKHIRDEFSPEKCGSRMEKRLNEILKNKKEWFKDDQGELGENQNREEIKLCVDNSNSESDYIASNALWDLGGAPLINRELLSSGDAHRISLKNELSKSNLTWDINYFNKDNTKGLFKGIKKIIKHVIQKLIYNAVNPILEEQVQFNANAVRTLNELSIQNEILCNEMLRLDQEIRSKQIPYNAALTRIANNTKNQIDIIKDECEQIRRSDQQIKNIIANNYNLITEEQEVGNSLIEKVDCIEKEIVDQINLINDRLTNLNQIDKIYKNSDHLLNKTEMLKNEIEQISKEQSILEGFDKVQEKLNSMMLQNDSNKSDTIQAAGSLYNAMYQRITSIDKTLISNSNPQKSLNNKFIESKWKLIDKYHKEPDALECSICGEEIITANNDKLVSEDMYGGGMLIRYICPCCGAIIGPSKMLELSDEELAEEYELHYQLNDEGQTTEIEIETFMSLKPEKGKRYLNYGCGSWTNTIDNLREQGYDVYGYDPYAPSDSEYIIKDINELLKMKFDGIFSHDLLEHLKKPIDEFEIFSKILTDNGNMAHSTGCYKYVYEYDRFHLVFYTGNAVNVLCEKTGFKVVDKQEDDKTLTYNYVYEKINGQ